MAVRCCDGWRTSRKGHSHESLTWNKHWREKVSERALSWFCVTCSWPHFTPTRISSHFSRSFLHCSRRMSYNSVWPKVRGVRVKVNLVRLLIWTRVLVIGLANVWNASSPRRQICKIMIWSFRWELPEVNNYGNTKIGVGGAKASLWAGIRGQESQNEPSSDQKSSFHHQHPIGGFKTRLFRFNNHNWSQPPSGWPKLTAESMQNNIELCEEQNI